jgi:hypothetical protein
MIRYNDPTRYDKAPYGTICHVHGDDDVIIKQFIQLSTENTTAQWEPLGDFLLKVFHEQLSNTTFIQECLKKYHPPSSPL